jgi:dTDP-4-amino-4,6-dideoxygalactose transaminase
MSQRTTPFNRVSVVGREMEYVAEAVASGRIAGAGAFTARSERLLEWAGAEGVRLPVVPAHCDHPAHLFHLMLPSTASRAAFLAHVRGRGIDANFHYVPLHSSDMGLAVGRAPDGCPRTTDAAARLVRLPLYATMTPDDVERVLDAARSFRVER